MLPRRAGENDTKNGMASTTKIADDPPNSRTNRERCASSGNAAQNFVSYFFRCACMHAKHLRRSREANEERGEARVGVLGCTDKSQKPSATCLYTADFKRCGGSHTRTMRLPRPSGIPYFACCRLSSARRSSVSSRASSSGINVDWQVITWPTLRDVAQ